MIEVPIFTTRGMYMFSKQKTGACHETSVLNV